MCTRRVGFQLKPSSRNALRLWQSVGGKEWQIQYTQSPDIERVTFRYLLKQAYSLIKMTCVYSQHTGIYQCDCRVWLYFAVPPKFGLGGHEIPVGILFKAAEHIVCGGQLPINHARAINR